MRDQALAVGGAPDELSDLAGRKTLGRIAGDVDRR
jgi:hypothetical protein